MKFPCLLVLAAGLVPFCAANVLVAPVVLKMSDIQTIFNAPNSSQKLAQAYEAMPDLLRACATNDLYSGQVRLQMERYIWTNSIALVVPTGDSDQISRGYRQKRNLMRGLSAFCVAHEKSSLLELARHVGELRPAPTNDFRARLMATCAPDATLRPPRRGAPYYGPNYRREQKRQSLIESQNRHQSTYRRLTLETYSPIANSVADSMPTNESETFIRTFVKMAGLSDAETAKWFPRLATQTVNWAASNAVMAPAVR